MKSKYSPRERIAILLEFLEKKRAISQICKEYGISRTLFYRWLQRYQEAEPGRAEEGIAPKKRHALHYSSQVPGWVERKILKIVREHPEYSIDRILRKLPENTSVGRHGVQRVLERLGLSTWQTRVQFANRRSRVLPALREKMIKRVIEGEEPVSRVCRDYRISRPVFYKWLKRYQQKGVDGLWDTVPEPGPHPLQASEEQEQAVLDVVLRDSSLSVSKIVSRLPKIEGIPILGHHGVQNVLSRRDLNTFEKRLAFTQDQAAARLPVRPVTGWLGRLKQVFEQFLPGRAPAPPTRYSFTSSLSGTSRRLVASLRSFLLFLFPFVSWSV